MTVGEAFEELVRIMHRLRRPGGCPWDGEQTHASIKPYTIEEAYEVAEAIDAGDDRELCTELGDLLLQIVFHAEMAKERKAFDVGDVIAAISDKMVRRHPHVFGDVQVSGADEVLRNWSRIKAAERSTTEDRSALAGVPRAMPALLRAQRLGEKAAHAGFDWQDPEGVIDKLREELDELAQAVAAGERSQAAAELGDLLFAATSLARHLSVNAEDATKGASDRFGERFRHMEETLAAEHRDIHDLSPEELESRWQAAKRALSDSVSGD
ncbi:MAG: nucleoside triphosphate pyrophosphohydrolase [Candidatus Binatia bacterium]